MGTATEQRAWQHRFGPVTVMPSHKTLISNFAAEDVLTGIVKRKLESAIKIAPLMVSAALDALNDMDLYKPIYKDREDAKLKLKSQPNPDMTDVGQALVKYFNLRYSATDARYWSHVAGVMAVYEKMYEGLSGSYEIVIADLSANAQIRSHGNVQTVPVSQIRATFGFGDEWDHSDYTWPERRGRIQVNFNYAGDRQVTASDVARTLVHEASHKWAHTKDVLYKASSWGKLPEPARKDLFMMGARTEHMERPDKAKLLLPLMGMDNQGRLIDRERWLENADSYAWMARRLWKRAGRPDA